MKLKVYTADGANFVEKEFEVPTFEGDKGLFALKETIVAYQANARQGNASALDYGHVSGTNKKPFKQKGTGRGRQGTNKSPIHRGGAVVFGPKPRDWSLKINKKAKKLAFTIALFDKCQEGGLTLIENFNADSNKTKQMVATISNILPEGKVLIIDEIFQDNVILSSRNIERVYLRESDTLNAFDLVRFNNIIASESAFNSILARAENQ